MVVRRRQLALGTVAAFVVLIGPSAGRHHGALPASAAACLPSRGCGHTHAWWDRPVLVAHVAEAPMPPRFTHSRG